ncbi:MAG: crossover junction endodeoxyribonuclease RuvC [Candidatus Absconditicoccaceae bacterium]
MILGVDPGVRKLGYAIITPNLEIIDAGILLQDQKSPTREDQFIRIKEIYDYFEKLIKKYKIKAVSIEKLFFTKFNQSNAEFVYGIRGALIMLFVKNNIQVKEFTPIQLKKAITGNGRADKILVQKFIMKLYGLKDLPKYNDTADALGLAYIIKNIK